MLSAVFDEDAYHVAPGFESGWTVRRGVDPSTEGRFSTKEEAVDFARRLAKQKAARLYIHRTNGTVASRHAYS